MEIKSKKRYFIVNPSGCLHEVTKELAAEKLATIGYRMATKAEIAKYKTKKGKQTVRDTPIGKPFSTDPDEAAEE